MRKFWISFFPSSEIDARHGLVLGYGVTAPDLEQALALIYVNVFNGVKPFVRKVVEDFDVKDVEKKHVYLNMGDSDLLGIWFPLGYHQFEPIHY